MAGPNPMRGEAELGSRKLAFTFNSWCALEARTGKKVVDLLVDLEMGLGFSGLRTWIRTFAVDELTEEQAGELIGENGTEAALRAIKQGVDGFFAPAEAREQSEDPPKAE